MSGSGGGSGDDNSNSWRPTAGSGGAIGGTISNGCNFTENTVLSSPNAAVVAKLAVGTVLDVVLVSGQVKKLLARTSSVETAGSITSARMLDLIECIEKGIEYGAKIKSIVGGRVEIEISPK